MTREEVKQMIVSYMTKKPGSYPDYRPCRGRTEELWELASSVFNEMFASGEIVRGTYFSKTGRKMSTLYLKEFSHLSVTPVEKVQ